MFYLGRDQHEGPILNWKDIWDNVLRFVEGLNSIDRDMVKPESLLPAHVADGSVYEVTGYREGGTGEASFINFPLLARNYATTTGQEYSNLQSYKVFRKKVNLDDSEVGLYIIQWRVHLAYDLLREDDTPGEWVAGTISKPGYQGFIDTGFLLGGRCSVDGVRIGGPFGADDITPSQHVYATDAEAADVYDLSGTSFCYLLPGSHNLDISVTTSVSRMVITHVDICLARFNW